MEWASEDNSVEKTADIAAAALFAAAVGFAAGTVGLGALPTIFAAVVASCVAFTGLRAVSVGNRAYDLPAFEAVPLEIKHEAADELVLDDVLESASPDARVIRLFDPAHESERAARANSSQPDASQALTEALAELRRMLR
jgi:hypothetical protein